MKDFLTSEQVKELRIAHRQEKRKKLADRIKIIIALNNGYSYKEIAEICMLDDETIRRYEKNFIEGGLEGLLSTDYKGGFSRLSTEQELALKLHLCQTTYLTTKEIAFHIYNQYGVRFTVSGTRCLIKRLGFIYKKPHVVPGKPDKNLQENFVKFYNKLSLSCKENGSVIYFMDAVHPTHNSKPAYGWILKGERKELKSNTGRQRININGALCLEKKEVIIEESSTINSECTIRLFTKILTKNKKAKKIHIIVDNAKYYRSSLLQKWIKGTKIKLHFLPPYSPNLNLIERLWKFFYKKVLYNKYYEKNTLFRNAVFMFFNSIKYYWDELESLLKPNFHLYGSCSFAK